MSSVSMLCIVITNDGQIILLHKVELMKMIGCMGSYKIAYGLVEIMFNFCLMRFSPMRKRMFCENLIIFK